MCDSYRDTRKVLDKLEELSKQIAAITVDIQALRRSTGNGAPDLRSMDGSGYGGSESQSGAFALAGKPQPIAIGRCENVAEAYLKSGECFYVCHEGRSDAADQVYDDGLTMIYDGDTPVARPRCLMPDCTPGSTFWWFGKCLMVTEIKDDLVFFEPVEPTPTDT